MTAASRTCSAWRGLRLSERLRHRIDIDAASSEVDFPLFNPASLSTALVALNFAAFAAFGLDKARAEAGTWRISEGALLLLALLGGSPGAWAGRWAFRHKTRKQPFNAQLFAITLLQVLGLGALVGWKGIG